MQIALIQLRPTKKAVSSGARLSCMAFIQKAESLYRCVHLCVNIEATGFIGNILYRNFILAYMRRIKGLYGDYMGFIWALYTDYVGGM